MTIHLNHIIVRATDKRRSAELLARLLGLAAPVPYSHFLVVRDEGGVSLDFLDAPGEIRPQHYAFLVSEAEFDQVLGRIKAENLPYWADPFHHEPDRINTNDGGRGVYWSDPDGHNLEIITRPYGG